MQTISLALPDVRALETSCRSIHEATIRRPPDSLR